jgi:hypothetical protein
MGGTEIERGIHGIIGIRRILWKKMKKIRCRRLEEEAVSGHSWGERGDLIISSKTRQNEALITYLHRTTELRGGLKLEVYKGAIG